MLSSSLTGHTLTLQEKKRKKRKSGGDGREALALLWNLSFDFPRTVVIEGELVRGTCQARVRVRGCDFCDLQDFILYTTVPAVYCNSGEKGSLGPGNVLGRLA